MGLEDHFDRIADAELRHLEKALADIDPDELDVELSQGVLTCTFGDDQKMVINSHHAAGQIWMAAFRTAWHFSPQQAGAQVEWRTADAELRSTVKRILRERLGRDVEI